MKKILLCLAFLCLSLNATHVGNSLRARMDKFLPNKKPAPVPEEPQISNSENFVRNEEIVSYEEELEQFFKTQKDVFKSKTNFIE